MHFCEITSLGKSVTFYLSDVFRLEGVRIGVRKFNCDLISQLLKSASLVNGSFAWHLYFFTWSEEKERNMRKECKEFIGIWSKYIYIMHHVKCNRKVKA